MMHMWYYLSDEIGHLLFEKWQISTTGGIIGACFAVASWVLLLEGIKTGREYLNKKSITRPSGSSQSVTEDPLLPSLVIPPTIATYRNKRIKYHVIQTLLHVLQVLTGYFIMLAVMTYNGWISITVAIVSGIAFHIFGAIRSQFQPKPSTHKSRSESGGMEGSSSSSSGHLQSTPSGMYPERT